MVAELRRESTAAGEISKFSTLLYLYSVRFLFRGYPLAHRSESPPRELFIYNLSSFMEGCGRLMSLILQKYDRVQRTAEVLTDMYL